MEMTFLVCNSARRPPHVSAGTRSRYDLNHNDLFARCTQAGDHVVHYVVTQSGNAVSVKLARSTVVNCRGHSA
nr:hypothetical protein JVH1_2198 [Rhodococcus sp. JVH1]